MKIKISVLLIISIQLISCQDKEEQILKKHFDTYKMIIEIFEEKDSLLNKDPSLQGEKWRRFAGGMWHRGEYGFYIIDSIMGVSIFDPRMEKINKNLYDLEKGYTSLIESDNQINVNDTFYLSMRAQTKNILGDRYGAFLDYSKCIKFGMKDYFIFTERGIIYQKFGNIDEACLDWRNARDLGDTTTSKYLFKEHCSN